MVTLRNVLVFTTSLCTQLGIAQGPCYSVTGRQLNPDYQRCVNLDGADSFCCATNRTVPYGGPTDASKGAIPQDWCLSIGLCQYQIGGVNEYWRPSCTAKDFSSPRCVSMCKNVPTSDNNDGLPVTPCDPTRVMNGTKWCCGSGNTNCCVPGSQEPGYTLLDLFASSASPSNASIPSNTASSLPNTASLPTYKTGLKFGAGVGIGIGAATCFWALLSLGFLLWSRRRMAPTSGKYEAAPPHDATLREIHEMPISIKTHEMPNRALSR